MAPTTRQQASLTQQPGAGATSSTPLMMSNADTDAQSTKNPVANNRKTSTSSTSKKRKVAEKPDNPRKKGLYYRESYGEPPLLPDLAADADDAYNDMSKKEDHGFWMSKETAKSEVTHQIFNVELNNGNGTSASISLNLADVFAKAGLTLTASPSTMTVQPILQLDSTGIQSTSTPQSINNDANASPPPQQVAGLLTIPAELRIKIYRLLLVENKPIDFATRRDLSRSATFLRTCKLLHAEGTDILYGCNSFHFARNTQFRGKFYEHRWTEIGFQDVRRFVETIGPDNVSKLKYVSLLLTDNMGLQLGIIPFPRFTQDPHLHHVFRLLGKHAILEKFGIIFASRAKVRCFDYHLLAALSDVKCYKLDFPVYLYGYRSNVSANLEPKLRELMVVPREESKTNKGKKVVKMVYRKNQFRWERGNTGNTDSE